MGINRADQAGDILGRSGTGNIYSKGHVLETSRNVCNPEEPAQVQPALSGPLHTIERDIKDPGVRRVDDLLAGAKGGQDQFDGSGTGVGAADQRWLIDVERKFTDANLGSVFVHQRGRRRERRHGRLRRVAEISAYLFDHGSQPIDLLHSHCWSPLIVPAVGLSPRRLLPPEAVFYIY